MKHVGKIVRLFEGGGYILEEGENGSLHGFTFGNITGYSNESRQELKDKGIFSGAVVKFTRVGVSQILSVAPLVWRQ